MNVKEYAPPGDDGWAEIQAGLVERGWSVWSLSCAVHEKHYSDGKTNWLPTPEAFDAFLWAWGGGKTGLGGEVLVHIEDELGFPLTDLCDSLIDIG